MRQASLQGAREPDPITARRGNTPKRQAAADLLDVTQQKKAAEDVLDVIQKEGTVEGHLDKMFSRKELYSSLGYTPGQEWSFPSVTRDPAKQ